VLLTAQESARTIRACHYTNPESRNSGSCRWKAPIDESSSRFSWKFEKVGRFLRRNIKRRHFRTGKQSQFSAWMLASVVLLAFSRSSIAQSQSTSLPTDPGLYVDTRDGFQRIIGQIAEFQRTGSLLVSSATAGIKTRKANVQLLGPHAQTIVSPQPSFYFIPARQESDVGVNVGDLILIQLEEKKERRQFEIAARGAWRASEGISLTHQIQLFRSEVKPGVYSLAPANVLSKGEYALYLARGEGLAPYVYDFGVEEIAIPAPAAQIENDAPRQTTSLNTSGEHQVHPNASTTAWKEPSIGLSAEGNPYIRHDGVTVTAVLAGGPADQVGIKAGDVILAINDHYIYTSDELRKQIRLQKTGTRINIRYQRRAIIMETELTVTSE
jgi:hypothetical protein